MQEVGDQRGRAHEVRGVTEAQLRYYERNKDKVKRRSREIYLMNREKAHEKNSQWIKEHPLERKEIKHRSYIKHKKLHDKKPKLTIEERRARGAERMRLEHKQHPERVRERSSRARQKYPLVFMMRSIVSSMMRRSGKTKSLRYFQYIGCSPVFLRNHLESLFKPGMTWGNHGTEWEIDHIVPISWFPFDKDSSVLFVASHWTNLQPLWKSENRSKRNLHASQV